MTCGADGPASTVGQATAPHKESCTHGALARTQVTMTETPRPSNRPTRARTFPKPAGVPPQFTYFSGSLHTIVHTHIQSQHLHIPLCTVSQSLTVPVVMSKKHYLGLTTVYFGREYLNLC